MTEDPWRTAVAASKTGLQAVLDAKGIPADAKAYVETVGTYADWYAQQSDFQAPGTYVGGPGPQMAAPQAKAVPDQYVAAVLKAGRICPAVTPAKIASQLMAASGFDPNKQSASGAQGIAQFPPEVWKQYAQSALDSPWNPDSAIERLGSALCDLSSQLSPLAGGDPYKLALAAFQWGATAVREAGGVPKSAKLQGDTNLAQTYVDYYAKDPRLTPGKAPSPSPSASQPASPAPPAPPASGKPAPPKPPAPQFDTSVSYQITNAWSGLVLDIPGDDNNPSAGVNVQQWHNQRAKDQFWRLVPVGKSGYYQIINGYSGKALAVKGDSHDDSAQIVQNDPSDSDGQQWQFQYAPNGSFWIANRGSGAVLDVYGDDDNTSDAGTIDQYHRQPTAQDQRWRLTR